MGFPPRGREGERTVDGEIAQRGAGGALDFNVGALEEEENGFEGIPIDIADV